MLIAAECLALFENRGDDLGGRFGIGKEIDESGAGNIDPAERAALRQGLDQRFGQGAGWLAGRLGQHQRQVGGVVAMCLVFRGVNLDGRCDVSRQDALVFQGIKRGGEQFEDGLFHD